MRSVLLSCPVRLVVPSSGTLSGVSGQLRLMFHWHPFSFISDGVCTLEKGEIDLQFWAALFFIFVFSRREAEQPSKVALLALSIYFFPSSFLLSTKAWSAKLTIYKIELIPIKIMVSPGIKLEYLIFLSSLGAEYY